MFASIIAAIGMCADGVAEGLYAARHRFSARAAGIGYAIGAILAWFYSAVTPITFTVESITVAANGLKKRPQILYVVALSAVPSILLGLFGLYSTFVSLLDPAVIAGVIAGVGIILTRVGVQYLGEKPAIAGASTAAGITAYIITDDLVPVIVASVVVGAAAAHFLPDRFLSKSGDKEEESGEQNQQNEQNKEDTEENEETGDQWGLIPFNWREMFTRPVLIGAFSVFALRTGAIFSYDRVNSELAGTEPTLDGVTLMAGLGSLLSALFGGPPVETTPAPMAAAPQPVFSTVLFMALMSVITLLGWVTRIGKYVPLQAIAGFLIVLGVPVIMPENLPGVAENPLAGGTALAVTALTNPFYGILVGEAVALLIEYGIVGGG